MFKILCQSNVYIYTKISIHSQWLDAFAIFAISLGWILWILFGYYEYFSNHTQYLSRTVSFGLYFPCVCLRTVITVYGNDQTTTHLKWNEIVRNLHVSS